MEAFIASIFSQVVVPIVVSWLNNTRERQINIQNLQVANVNNEPTDNVQDISEQVI